MRGKRIVLTGGPCCGKTTVLEEIKRRGYEIVPEMARDVLIERRECKESREEWAIRQRIIYDRQVEAEENLNGGIHLLDRGLLDVVAYSKKFLGYLPETVKVDELSNRYDAVLVLEPLPFKKDGVRYETPEEAAEIHDMIIVAYEEFGYQVKHVPVVFGESVEEAVRKRADLILEILEVCEKHEK